MSDQATAQSTADQSKFKIKVAGVEKEVTREEIIELAQKGDDYTRKTQAVSEKERELKALEEQLKPIKAINDEMVADKGLSDVLNKTYKDYKEGKISKSQATDRNLKLLDKKIEEAKNRGDRETEDSLRDVRDIIGEEVNVKPLEEKLAKLEQELSSLKNLNLVSLDGKIDKEMEALDSDFGKENTEKYKKEIREAAVKYPNQTVEKLFKYYANADDLDKALLYRAEKRKKEETDRKKNGSVPGFSSSTERIEPARDKHGRVDMKDFIAKVKDKYRI